VTYYPGNFLNRSDWRWTYIAEDGGLAVCSPDGPHLQHVVFSRAPATQRCGVQTAGTAAGPTKGGAMAIAKDVHDYITLQRKAVAQNPDCGTSHYNLAVGLLGLKQYEEAEQELLAAIDCSPTLAEAYVQLGGICLQRGDLDGCLEWNKRAVNTRAGFSEGWGNIGFVHLQKGNIQDAIYALEKATRWNPKFIQAKANLANAYLMNGQREESIAASLQVLELEPNFAVAHNNLAIAFLEAGDYERARRHCDKATALGYTVADAIRREIEGHFEA
jgi:tetratricopeptide (TPR) repeat protein